MLRVLLCGIQECAHEQDVKTVSNQALLGVFCLLKVVQDGKVTLHLARI